ncbi:hypothetical protein ABT56_17060 [Photobacterium aquae]|uniref:Uncharacterized protein n=1 Tax=Photobacterium aquae TaxID=1195763 RepID=A0A0J1GWF4_9GAMM|nr:SDR family NAD(P)-dependent oxidoreductase [Photobacterium aquae]KLV03941.1 hypothetical protein ABT56_17060 [Photobacterium aquae]
MKHFIVGASGGIGLALVGRSIAHGNQVTALTRQASPKLLELRQSAPRQLAIIEGDLLTDTAETQSKLNGLFRRFGKPDWTINAAGILHHGQSMPEKKLDDVTPDSFQRNLEANTYLSIALAQYLATGYQRADPFRFICLSALVGSISDNRTGGWYSYRMSKAALNMFVKTLSHEWRRQYPNAIVAAIHPGTTATDLSAPFWANIADGKLFSPSLTAERLLTLIATIPNTGSGQFFHWDGTQISW